MTSSSSAGADAGLPSRRPREARAAGAGGRGGKEGGGGGGGGEAPAVTFSRGLFGHRLFGPGRCQRDAARRQSLDKRFAAQEVVFALADGGERVEALEL